MFYITENGKTIDKVESVEEGFCLILELEKLDMLCGIYKDNQYDILDENKYSYLQGGTK